MNGRLAGKNAVITGAAGDIDLQASVLFALEGASILMTDPKADVLAAALARVKAAAPQAPGRIEARVVDVTREADVADAINSLDGWGGLDVMFNNAGIMHPRDGDSEEVPENIWDLTFNINVKGVWYGSKHAVKALRKHGKSSGSIINTASMVAIVGDAAAQLAYTASKGAVLALTRELAIEGFRFNSLPSPSQDFLGSSQETRQRREIYLPTGRFGEPIEQAYAVVFLASDESSFVIGHDMVVDGGLTKAYVIPLGPALAAPNNLG
ncbi:oxidoreductase [Ilyonectria robusta]|uniref:oxidoreductase n=1 Tax=Ilyonectria robusta TaxID=1079257 RepID=UPI001E8D216D|nr:oxidoreductase [Ilyonectria robusta]KAH8672289.1 oxidoreductase [Ilyonectria robusta]